MKQLLALATTLGLVVLGPLDAGIAAEYLETFDRDANPAKVMAGSLLIGDDGVWNGELDGDAYVLSNAGKKGVARFYSVEFKQGPEAGKAPNLTVGVDIAGRFDSEIAGAGLIYGQKASGKAYYAFLVNQGGGYTVFQREPKGLRKIASGKNDAILSDGVNRLSVTMEADKARLFVNESQVLAHSARNAMQGKAGIFALDRGSFRFDNFRLESE